MRTYFSQRRLWGIISMLVMASILMGGQLAQAQPPAPAATSITYLPLVAGGVGAAPISAVRMIADSQHASQAAIGPEGGILSAVAADGTRFDLLISPDALDFTEIITMAPVLQAENLPLSGGLIGAVNLEPAGLDFYTPAILRIMSPRSAPTLLTIGFAYDGDGAQFHLRPILAPTNAAQLQAVTEPTITTLQITALRGVGAALGTAADIDKQQAQPSLSDRFDVLEQELVDAWVEEQQSKLEQAYQTSVLPLLQRAQSNDQLADEAIKSFDRWVLWVDEKEMRPHFFTQITQGRNLLGRIIPHASAAAAERCFSQKRPEEGFRLLRWLRYARKYLSNAEVVAIQAQLSKCLRFELTFNSHMTEGGFGDPFGYLYDLQAKLVLRGSTGMNAVGAGPLEWQEVSWIGSKGGCPIAVAGVGSTFDAQRPSFGLSITPVSRMSPAVNISLRYHPGTPGEHISIVCPGGGGFESSQNGWLTYFGQTHAKERDGAGYRVTAQVVGAGSFPGWNYPRLTTSGPSGQAVIETTQIALVHAPER